MSNRQTSSSLLARRYAAALFELAKAKNAVDAVAAELSALAKAAAEPSARAVFESPLISKQKQKQFVGKVATSLKFSEATQKFLDVLAENRRLNLIGGIAVAFEALARAHRGEAEVEVTSAKPLTAENKATLVKALEAATKNKITLTGKVDESLIGGLTIRMGSKQLDLSIKGKLERLISAQKRAA